MASVHVAVSGVAKTSTADFPLAVVNELICADLARAVKLPIPPSFLVHDKDGKAYHVSLNFHLSGEDLPPADAAAIVADFPELACGIVLFDMWICNGDRHAGNIAYDKLLKQVTLFDHSHAFLHGQNGQALLEGLRSQPAIGGHCLANQIKNIDGFANWQDRITTSLVSEEGMALALGGEEAEIITVPLQDDVGTAFGQVNVLADQITPPAGVKYPIHRNAAVTGKTATHKPAFYQHNGHPVVMETIDLTVVNRRVALRDHAGWAAFIFGDIKAQDPSAEPISIARITSESERDKNVKYAIDLLQSQSRLINWLSEADRVRFIEERVAVAKG